MKHTFATPYEFEGKSYDAVEFDLGNLKGSDISAAKKEFAAMGNFSPLPSTDSDFCALLLCRLTKHPLEFYMGLPAPEYCALTTKVSNFLIV